MDSLLEMLGRLNLWTWWAIAGLFLIGEVMTGTTYLLWLAGAATLTGFVGMEFLGVSWPVQLGVFAVLSLILLWAGGRWLTPMLKAGVDSGLNERGSRMVGETVIAAADFVSGRGRVKFGDTEWAAQTVDGSNPNSKAELRVVELDGVTLKVSSS
jgi:membrane protein implicated in regulation of membrane protease activity